MSRQIDAVILPTSNVNVSHLARSTVDGYALICGRAFDAANFDAMPVYDVLAVPSPPTCAACYRMYNEEKERAILARKESADAHIVGLCANCGYPINGRQSYHVDFNGRLTHIANCVSRAKVHYDDRHLSPFAPPARNR